MGKPCKSCHCLPKWLCLSNHLSMSIGVHPNHYIDVIKTTMASEITSLTVVYSGTHQRKRQSSASLAFMRGIHRGPVNSPNKWPVSRKCFHLMTSSWSKKYATSRQCQNDSGAHFTNNFSITIQMWWKFHFALIQILIKWSLQYLAHGTTAGLSWHVPNFVAMWSSVIELELNEISITFELWWKNR